MEKTLFISALLLFPAMACGMEKSPIDTELITISKAILTEADKARFSREDAELLVKKDDGSLSEKIAQAKTNKEAVEKGLALRIAVTAMTLKTSQELNSDHNKADSTKRVALIDSYKTAIKELLDDQTKKDAVITSYLGIAQKILNERRANPY